MIQKGPDGPKRVPNGQKRLGWPFWSLLDPFGPLWSVDKAAMFGPHHHVSYVWAACGTPFHTVWNINIAAIQEKCQK